MFNPVKKHLTYTIRDFYTDYRKACEKDRRFKLKTRKQYKEFITDVFSEMFQRILEESWHFVLPYSLGEFYIKETKKKYGQPVLMRGATVRAGKAVYTFNNHTLRKVFKFVWDKTYANFPTAKYYKFRILSGDEPSHKKYKVGKRAISEFYKRMGSDPTVKMIQPYSKSIRTLEEPRYD